MKACIVPDCPKPAGVPGTARGWCSMHYNRWKRTGDPLTSLADLKPKAPDDCSVEGCDWPRWARGWCATHYQRWRSRGEPGAAERELHPTVGRCSVLSCKKPDKNLGFCNAHLLRYYRHGDPLAGKTFMGLYSVCQIRYCDRTHYALGLCHAHWSVLGSVAERTRRVGAPIPGVCTAAQLIARIDYYGNRCWMCSAPADQTDHVKPLAAGGSNWPSNLRPSCAACNMHKQSTWPFRPESLEGAAS